MSVLAAVLIEAYCRSVSPVAAGMVVQKKA